MRSKLLIAAAGLFLLALVGLNWYTSLPVRGTAAPVSIDEAAEFNRWSALIKKKGPQEAYRTLKRAAEGYSIPDAHVLAHSFGRALFAEEGLAGVSACDDSFSYGCFHEFLAQAIVASGLGSVKELDAGCERQATDLKKVVCQHGIGHGVMGALGYDGKALKEALEVCKGLPYAASAGGCYSGAFMEYNRRTMIARESGPRLPIEGDYASPCDDVADEFRRVCVLWQPQWWHGVVFSAATTTEVASELGAMCRTLESSIGYGDTCMRGVGMVFGPYAVENPELARTRCDAAGAGAEDRAHCRSWGAYVVGLQAGSDRGRLLCEGLAGADASECLRYATAEGLMPF